MKTIGLVGGMSWQSTAEYYRIINETVAARLGGLHSAKIVMVSVDFAEIEPLQHQAGWDELAGRVAAAARSVERAGADFLVLCTNTMHKVADEIEKDIRIPLLHIADAAAERIKALELRKVGLLGTKFTMEDDFYRSRLAGKHGLDVVIPPPPDRELVHRVIFEELCLGKTEAVSRRHYIRIMGHLISQGAEGIVLGCTEIGLLVGCEDAPAPVFDTTRIHAAAAAEFALES